MKRLILFDLDGVLLHSQENMRQAWGVVCEKASLDIPFEAYFSHIGRPFEDILRCLGITTGLEKIEKIYMAASFDFLSQAAFFPGVQETLVELVQRGLKLGIVTSKDRPRTQAILPQLGVDFITVQCPTGKMRGKPAPDYLLVAMAEAGEDPQETLFVGDMETDYQAAQRACVDYVHAGWGYGQPIASVATLDSISDLPKFIQ